MSSEPPREHRPDWLFRAWRIRAVLLAGVLGLLTLVLTARWGWAPWALPPVLALALWADWAWLGRNHHRVDEWGLSKGKNFRRRPK